MNKLRKIFSLLFKSKTDSSDNIQQTTNIQEVLIEKQRMIEGRIRETTITAKQNRKTNKREALKALAEIKRLERRLKGVDGQLSKLEMQKDALEDAKINTKVLQTVKNNAKAIRTNQKDMSVEKVHDIMDNMIEQQDVHKEITEAFSNPLPNEIIIDENDLELEFNELDEIADEEEEELIAEKLLEINIESSHLPISDKENFTRCKSSIHYKQNNESKEIMEK